MTAFRADPRDGKVDLGVGMYKDETENIPVFDAVHQAELRLAERNAPKAYEGPRGNVSFCEGVTALLYGDAQPTDRLASFTTPGGCGALGDGMALIKRMAPDARVWMSDPCWANHPHVTRTAGLTPVSYPYLDQSTGLTDANEVVDGLSALKPG